MPYPRTSVGLPRKRLRDVYKRQLLVVPIISMGAAAARLGMSRRERDLAVLRLVGLAPGKTKLACILETCVFAVVGVVVGSILYAVTLPAWGALSFQGRPMGASEMWVGVVALLVEGLAMILLAALSSWLAMRKVAITPLGVARLSLIHIYSASEWDSPR